MAKRLPPHLQRFRDAMRALPQPSGALPGDVGRYTKQAPAAQPAELPGTSTGSGVLPGAEGGKPKAFWASPYTDLRFGAVNTAYGTATQDEAASQAVWRTPLFDLRPDLGYRSGLRGDTVPIGRDVLVGDYFNLFCGLELSVTVGRKLGNPVLYSMEYGAPYDTLDPPYLNSPLDVTIDALSGSMTSGVSGDKLSSVLRWSEPGTMRYWGVLLIIDQLDGGAGVGLRVRASGGLH